MGLQEEKLRRAGRNCRQEKGKPAPIQYGLGLTTYTDTWQQRDHF